MGYKSTRRGLLALLLWGILDSASLAMGGVGYSDIAKPRLFTVERIRLRLKRLPGAFSGFRFVQISDIHMGGWMNVDRFQQVADLVKQENPEVLLITGDFLLGHSFTEASRQGIQDLIRVLSPLAAAIPSFAILGNHDYWTSAKAIRQMLASCRVTDLTNTVVTLTRQGEALHLCGVDDIWKGDVRLNDVLAQLNDDSVAILLAHEPDFADISAATKKFDLQLSGHTHGGQVVMPVLGPPVLPYLGRKYPSGLYRVGDMYQYTSRGVGMNTIAVRFNCPPEITVFELERME